MLLSGRLPHHLKIMELFYTINHGIMVGYAKIWLHYHVDHASWDEFGIWGKFVGPSPSKLCFFCKRPFHGVTSTFVESSLEWVITWKMMWTYSLSSFVGGIFSFMCLHGLSLVKTFRVVTFLLSYGFNILFEKMRWSVWFGSVSTCTLKVAKEGL